jgi:hypothetical protein
VIVAVFARKVRPGVSVDDFVRAWAPDDGEPYPAGVEVGVDPADDRRFLTIVRFEGDLQAFQAAMPRLIHPESHRRLAELVESTELESVYESVAVTV